MNREKLKTGLILTLAFIILPTVFAVGLVSQTQIYLLDIDNTTRETNLCTLAVCNVEYCFAVRVLNHTLVNPITNPESKTECELLEIACSRYGNTILEDDWNYANCRWISGQDRCECR